MDEREMLQKIAESAKDLEVPEALKPDQVRNRLKGSRTRKGRRYQAIAAAACLCLCFGLGGLAYQNHTRQQAYMQQVQDAEKGGAAGHDAWKLPAAKDAAEEEPEAPVKKLGKMYTLASDYGAVYDVLEKGREKKVMGREEKMEHDVEAADSQEVYNTSMGAAAADKDSLSENQGSSFSSTNLQVAGVDESDFVKTDGKFIYVVQDARIQVIDVRSPVPAAVGAIQPDLDEDTDRICEMYVADGMLAVIIQTEETDLQEETAEITMPQEKEDAQAKKLAAATDDVQYIATTAVTKVLSYDIADPQKPALKDTAVQDGWYRTSRKVGSRLYLFTEQSLRIAEGMQRQEAVQDGVLELWVPSVNHKIVSADCIYLQERGEGGLLMACIDLADHNKVLDTKLMVSSFVQMYVSARSVYLYYSDYANEAVRTRIARFALEEDGTIRAIAAKTLKGNITDTFAVHEREGYLQVLTSVTSSDPWENRVYVLDENMEITGKLTGLAKGEQIYSARFTGNIGYFVTYRNTDPLFTVDFTDPKEPKIIGELEVTGFSEYLHFWSDSKLLGIGYETDPDSGEILGVKLSMFDISNPVKVKEEAKYVMEGMDDCDGTYDYKAVLVDAKKNLIAFTTEKYGEKYQKVYQVFSYADGKFDRQVARTLAAGVSYNSSRWRSVYVGDMLYLVNEKKMIAFAIEEGWKEIAKLEYGKEEFS